MTLHIQSLLQRFVRKWELNNLFVIVSAIGNNYGCFTYQQRFEQLLESIESIRKYASGSDIAIYDASEDSLPENDVNTLRSLVNQVVFLYNDKYINFLKHHSKDPSPNKFEKKTVGEIQATVAFLDFLRTHPIKYKRVFKLTGRYQLNENFKLEDYDDKEGKCVLANKEEWFGEHVFVIRLWSFDYNDLELITHFFHTIQKHTYDLAINKKRLEVVEFTFTDFIESLKIPHVTLDRIGICGLSGQDAIPIYE